MQKVVPYGWKFVALVALAAGLGWPASADAQTAIGQASAALVTVGAADGTSTTTLSDTGSLSSSTDARESSQSSGAIESFVSGEALHATTIGWSDQVASEASIANVSVTAGGSSISADFAMARATDAPSNGGNATVRIDGLSINGVAIPVTGKRNQRVDIPGGVVVINEQRTSGGALVVNALHIVIDGGEDVVIASATAKAP
jgi:hypothetical protein